MKRSRTSINFAPYRTGTAGDAGETHAQGLSPYPAALPTMARRVGAMVGPAGGAAVNAKPASAWHDLASEALFQALGDNAYELDREFRFVTFNAGCAAYYGTPTEAALGRPVWDVMPGSRGSWLEVFLREAMATRRPARVERSGVVRPDRSVEVTAFPTSRGLGVAFRDRTAEHHAAETLRESEAWLRLAQQAGGVGTWEWDVATGALRWSEECHRIHGTDPCCPVTVESWREGIHPEDQARVQAELATLLASPRTGWEVEFRYRRRSDGTERWIVGRGEVVCDVAGRPLRMLGVSLDVTERRAAEARLQLALEAGRMAVFELDVAKDAVVGSPELNRLFGFPPHAEPTREERRARYFPGEREQLLRIGREALARGERFFEAEFRCVWPDGSVRWLLLRAEMVSGADGRVTRVLGVLVDVTDRKAAEAALGETDERLRLATEAAEVGFWDIDPVAGTLVWSPRVYAIFGVPPGTPVGRADFLNRLYPDDRAVVETAYAAAANPAQRAPYDVEYRVLGREDGTVRWVASKGRGLFDKAGRCIRVIGTAIDVTGRKQAEAALAEREVELRRLNETLEHRVSEAVAAREDAQARLAHAQRMEALGQLAGGIAHDFNNVLQAVQGGARLIEAAPGDAPRVLRLARMVADAAKRGAAVTRRLLAFSRRAELRAEPTDVTDLLTAIQEVLAHTLGAGIRIELSIEPRLPPLFADKGQLETALVNLAANARDAMAGQGVITLSAAAALFAGDEPRRPPRLGPGAYVRLGVRDTGEGMTPEVLARASEPFFTTKPEGKGTGLGLAMARGFAEQSGGALHIESTPEIGTTVALWLPVADAELPAAAPAIAPQAGERTAQVLLVDDEAAVRDITAEGLRAAGYAVRPAASAAEALAHLDAGGVVDILVSDLSMPGIDGLALVREAQRRQPGLPAILLTGFVTDAAELAMGGALSGAFTLLRKPVEPAALAERMAVLLEGREAEGGRRAGVGTGRDADRR
ncbi:hybrid sensor histidine kinase/response regulator [Paracraurococcus lichenis]|uniref:histidine kinase n=1 Tax=Paracraurococcus lichenis TaxID=3064888 RepID=A0ABT9EDE7_9PROT|nr:PAS domain-containing protein [Paracraurococcus sp. LOR1-02]MDO9714250.1 PAS domain-containing protein [Paracraurococcus sp. LOR1-02]